MKRTAFALIVLALGFSCSEPEQIGPDVVATKAEPIEPFMDTTAVIDTIEEQNFRAYLVISSLYEDWPSETGSSEEIDWHNDTTTKRYSRNYYQLDTLIQGRPVFADSLNDQFFFYLPFNFCWILHSEFPDADVMSKLKGSVAMDFSDVVASEGYYRCGFEYGPADTWDLEKLVFSKEPWNHSPNISELYGSGALVNRTSMYQLKWVGKDPMAQLKEDWTTEHKTKLLEEWTAAYDQYIADESGSTGFVPKPIGIDYKNSLRAYFAEQYKTAEVIKNEYDVKLGQEEFEMIKDHYGFTTVNEEGVRMVSPGYSHGRTIQAVFESEEDTLVIPWPSDMEEKYGSGISYHEEYQPFYSVIDGKMWESGHYFSFPKAEKKYLLVLLEFLYGDTYVLKENEGNKEYWERIYMMPSIDDMQRELGCIFTVTETRIDFFCDEGGC